MGLSNALIDVIRQLSYHKPEIFVLGTEYITYFPMNYLKECKKMIYLNDPYRKEMISSTYTQIYEMLLLVMESPGSEHSFHSEQRCSIC